MQLMLLQQGGRSGRAQDPCCVLPPYSGQPFPGQCAASRHPCAWERGPWGTDGAPRRRSMVLALLPPYAPRHPRTEFCNGLAAKIAAPIFLSSTPWTSLHTPCRHPANYRHSWCLRTHNTSRSDSPSSAEPDFLWDWSFPAHRIRF